MQQYTYLIINILTVFICFIYSFDKRIEFHKHFSSFIKGATIVALPFIIWDAWFTSIGVWWFNDNYLVGVRLLGLPIEEIMFFFFIPFSCVFTYYCMNKFFDLSWANSFNTIIVFVTTIVCITVALLYPNKLYTFITAIATCLSVLYLHFIAKKDWIGQASLLYTVLMLGFFPVNGVLTGTGLESPIVNYNDQQFLTIRMGTIPIEDAVYGYTMFIWNIYFFHLFSGFKPKRNTAQIAA